MKIFWVKGKNIIHNAVHLAWQPRYVAWGQSIEDNTTLFPSPQSFSAPYRKTLFEMPVTLNLLKNRSIYQKWIWAESKGTTDIYFHSNTDTFCLGKLSNSSYIMKELYISTQNSLWIIWWPLFILYNILLQICQLCN